jgi:hypothetical protein
VGLRLLGYPLRPIKRCVVLAGFALLTVACPPAQAQALGFKENAVKAVFLFNFAQFVEWPPQAFCARALDSTLFSALSTGTAEGYGRKEGSTKARLLFHAPQQMGSAIYK